MKHMHFKASCSYAALAAIMELNGVDTEDYKIALEIKLPWLFSKEDGAYISGPMLQRAKWFNLWLAPRGYRLVEEIVERGSFAVIFAHTSLRCLASKRLTESTPSFSQNMMGYTIL